MEEEVSRKGYDSRLMRRLFRYAWPYRRAVAASVALMLVNAGLNVSGPLLTKFAIDRYLRPTQAGRDSVLAPYLSGNPWTGLTQVSMIFLLLLIVGLVSEFAQSYLMQSTGQRAIFDLRRELMEHLQKLDIRFFDRNPVGRLVTRVTTDTDALNETLASGVVAIFGDVLVLVFLLITMFVLSPGMTVVLLAAAPLVLGASLIFRASVRSGYRRTRIAVAKISAYLQERVTGMAVVQLFNRERKSSAEFQRFSREYLDAYKDTIFAYGWFYPVVEFVGTLSVAGLIIYGGLEIRRGDLTLGVLVAFFHYGMRFFRPIQDLSEKYNVLLSAMAAAERVFDLLDTPVGIERPPAAKPFPGHPAAIEFDGVWYAYKGEDWVLEDLTFTVRPGETVALVGHTGAGKTTIASLLLRFYDVQRGGIRIGGIDIREFDPRELRRHFGVVLQDPHLFTGTIEDNIRLGTTSITEQDLMAAAENVNLLDFIQTLPEGFRHPVHERGAGLSTGQKQLIGFARALAHNPRFLLLDEATSSVDTETELRIRAAMIELLEGRTSLVIAHRLSTIQRADRILVMHRGRLRETGTHQELLARRGLYYKLYQLQYKDQEIRSPLLTADR